MSLCIINGEPRSDLESRHGLFQVRGSPDVREWMSGNVKTRIKAADFNAACVEARENHVCALRFINVNLLHAGGRAFKELVHLIEENFLVVLEFQKCQISEVQVSILAAACEMSRGALRVLALDDCGNSKMLLPALKKIVTSYGLESFTCSFNDSLPGDASSPGLSYELSATALLSPHLKKLLLPKTLYDTREGVCEILSVAHRVRRSLHPLEITFGRRTTFAFHC